MDILTTLMQLFGNCAGGTCGQAAQAAAPVTETVSNLGGFSGLMGLLCQLFGIGC